MNNSDYIDSYFQGELLPDKSSQFEQRIISDPDFADEVAEYLRAFQVAKEISEEEKKEKFREILQQSRPGKTAGIVGKIWPYFAAAALLTGIILGIDLFMQPVSPKQLADQYVKENLQKLSVEMGTKEDSMQTGIKLYNDGKLTAALAYFSGIASNDSNSRAIEYSGVVYLRLQQYDKALVYFEKRENYQGYSNPGKFYHALTLMERNHPGDKEQAKQLLKVVMENDLSGKKEATEWYKKL